MKIFGTGIDIVEIQRFKEIKILLFAKKILSEIEFQDFENIISQEKQKLFLAKRFCIKESVAKAFGIGIGKNLSFKDITITKNTRGKPICNISTHALKNIISTDVIVHISLSDTKNTIISSCVIELNT